MVGRVSRNRSTVDRIADDFTARYAALDPIFATESGIPGHDHEMTDLSPAGHATRVALRRQTLAALEGAAPVDETDRVTIAAMRFSLGTELALDEAGETLAPVNNIASAVQGLPVRPELFAPFLADVAAARTGPLLKASDLERTSMAMALQALLFERDGRWSALLPLNAPPGADIRADRIRAALGATGLPEVLFVDMKSESDRLYAGYLREAGLLSLGGLVAIIALLLLVIRSPTRVMRIVAPLAAAVVTVTAALVASGQQLIILHLVGLLLVVAVGSNYALFLDQSGPGTAIAPRTLASMLFANLTTVAGFGVLAFSSVSLLQAMGATVAPGVVLALLYAAIFARRSRA